MHKVKILQFPINSIETAEKKREKAAEEIAKLLDDGWRIEATSGAGAQHMVVGFVIMVQKMETEEPTEPTTAFFQV